LTRELIDDDISTSARVLRAASITIAKKIGRGLMRFGRFIAKKLKA